jgi:hypothetical protein
MCSAFMGVSQPDVGWSACRHPSTHMFTRALCSSSSSLPPIMPTPLPTMRLNPGLSQACPSGLSAPKPNGESARDATTMPKLSSFFCHCLVSRPSPCSHGSFLGGPPTLGSSRELPSAGDVAGDTPPTGRVGLG